MRLAIATATRPYRLRWTPRSASDAPVPGLSLCLRRDIRRTHPLDVASSGTARRA